MPTGLQAASLVAVFATCVGFTLHQSSDIFQAQGRDVDLPEMREVRHLKAKSGGYLPGSPLHQEQLAREAADEAEAEIATEPKARPATEAPQVSTAMVCVVNLTTQVFVIYTVLFIVQATCRLKGVKSEFEERLEKYLIGLTDTVFFVPILCIVFLVLRVRTVQLTQGHLKDYSLPQVWVEVAMEVASWAIVAQSILAIIYSFWMREPWGKDSTRGLSQQLVAWMRETIMCLIYGGFAAVCYGIYIMPAPADLWGIGGGPELDPALVCVLLLAIFYFPMYSALIPEYMGK
eukprot:NODE_2290_length_960_cov_390.670718.p1 GENE.NODE_2290_length_960_cov_390.670718~~NODE_2290_length_960_cov_390.670718.p1  ORF type:complete len:290 (+),score=55.74 NODE_2290_length_960_cov_390.670718:46-915(+)